MVDSGIRGELTELAAVRGQHRAACQPANNLQMMAAGDRVDLAVAAVNDHAGGRERVTGLMLQEIEREMRSMLRVRTFQPQRRQGDERDNCDDAEASAIPSLWIEKHHSQLNNQMTCRALDARRFMLLHAMVSESVSQEFKDVAHFETRRGHRPSRCRAAEGGVENERDAARQAGAPAVERLSSCGDDRSPPNPPCGPPQS